MVQTPPNSCINFNYNWQKTHFVDIALSEIVNSGLLYCAVPENIHTPPTESFLFYILPPPPKEIPVYLHILLLKF